jgi:hypothetical protein
MDGRDSVWGKPLSDYGSLKKSSEILKISELSFRDD